MPVSEGFGDGDGRSAAHAAAPLPLLTTAPGSKATIAFVNFVSWWHTPIYTLDWRAKQGLYRNNYDTRVSECMWLNNNRGRTVEPPCKPSINLTTAKAHVRGTGAFINFVNDEVCRPLSLPDPCASRARAGGLKRLCGTGHLDDGPPQLPAHEGVQQQR